MDKHRRNEYAEQWNESATFFQNNSDYKWSTEFLKGYERVLEIGSGTGQSTLALLDEGHKVIAVEKNEKCITLAKKLITSNGYKYSDSGSYTENVDVHFVLGDISDEVICQELLSMTFDISICWNVGTHWSKEMMEEYIHKLLSYGLTVEQIRENPESSYGEYIQWKTCEIARRNMVPVHIIDRSIYETNTENDVYYYILKNQLGFYGIEYSNKKTLAKSVGGRVLSIDGTPYISETMEIYLTSILMTL